MWFIKGGRKGFKIRSQNHKEGAGEMAQVIENLPSKCEVLSSSTAKKTQEITRKIIYRWVIKEKGSNSTTK
jgi:hypothetical protein